MRFDSLNPQLVDMPEQKKVLAFFNGIFKPLPLWEDDAYDAIGDWTQAQAEARLLELLGDNPQAVLQGLVQ
jgi:hypothetical protein